MQLFAGAYPLLTEQLLGAIIPNYLNGVNVCLYDFIGFGLLIVVGRLIVVQTKYILNTSKMDGAGFRPLFQRNVAIHVSKLPQIELDTVSEADVMALIENDVSALNDVISAWFDLISSGLELLMLVPVLFVISLELSLVMLFVVPPFIYLQLRSGGFIMKVVPTRARYRSMCTADLRGHAEHPRPHDPGHFACACYRPLTSCVMYKQNT